MTTESAVAGTLKTLLETTSKIPTHFLVALTIAGAVFLRFPAWWGSVPGWAFPAVLTLTLICGVWVSSRLLGQLGDWLKERLRQRQARKRTLNFLATLGVDEKRVLARYLRADVGTMALDYTAGIGNALESAGVLGRTSGLGCGTSFPYTLQPWVRSHLRANPELVGLTRDEFGKLDLEREKRDELLYWSA